MEEMLEKAGEESLLYRKMKDVKLLYTSFKEYLEGHYITGEGVMDALRAAIPFSAKMKNSVVLLDGYHRFTPMPATCDPGAAYRMRPYPGDCDHGCQGKSNGYGKAPPAFLHE